MTYSEIVSGDLKSTVLIHLNQLHLITSILELLELS